MGYMSINKTQLDRRVKLNLELYMKVGKESIRVAKNMNCGINHIGILLRMEKTFGNYLADMYTVNIQSLKTLQSSYMEKQHLGFVQVLIILKMPFILTTVIIRSEEHTSELQSRFDLVCRLLLEKKNHI